MIDSLHHPKEIILHVEQQINRCQVMLGQAIQMIETNEPWRAQVYAELRTMLLDLLAETSYFLQREACEPMNINALNLINNTYYES